MTTFTALAPTLIVPDVEATAAWFSEFLGFETTSLIRGHGPGDDGVPDGPEHVHTGPADFCFVGKDDIRLMLRRASDGRARLNREASEYALDCYFWVTGLDELHARCLGRVTIAEALGERFYGMRDFTLHTPDGHALCFGEPMDPA
jgi:catechol 2,3-dioxygenase-like lactoylglutathione lyase family enzyme